MSDAKARIPSIWTTGWTDQLRTGTWRNAVAVHKKRGAPCHGACPVEGEIPLWVRQMREGDSLGAWQTLVAHNPLPAVVGRTCHHPCETGCNRNDYDGAVSINALEQYLGDLAIQEDWALPAPEAELESRVAVVGAGPAGLSCAYHLRRRGFRVALYDANPELGGVLRYGVPEYRLPRKVLAAEVKRIVALGVEVVAGRALSARDLPELEENFAAVFIAFGAQAPKMLPQFPRDDRRVMGGLAFLRLVAKADPPELGAEVLVIGGGSVAMDVAGCALRLGSRVRVVSLESREALPATAEEVEDALLEGATLIDAAMVKEVEEAQGGRLKLRCLKAELDPAAPAGAIWPLEVAGSDFELLADTVILAVGQDPELADWQESVELQGRLVKVDRRFMTSRPGLFAAGDLASDQRLVSVAIGDGKRAAGCIADYLQGGKRDRPKAETEAKTAAEATEETNAEAEAEAEGPEVAFSDINTFYFPKKEPRQREKVAACERSSDFREIKLGFNPARAALQAERCFSCGACTKCDNCFYFCPDMAIVKDPSLPLQYQVLDQYCKGCGCCLAECPRGAVSAKEESK